MLTGPAGAERPVVSNRPSVGGGQSDEDRQLRALRSGLVLDLDDQQTLALDRAMSAVLATFDGAAVRTYVPLLVAKHFRHAARSVLSPGRASAPADKK